MMQSQKGVGLMEILVALVLLGVAVLGFVGLQIRAIAASNEATMNVQATNIARDMAERMRVNRAGISNYTENTDSTKCNEVACSPKQMAEYDYREIKTNAANLGMQFAVLNCQGFHTSRPRKCVYVAWGGTTATDGTVDTACTNGTSYISNAKCIIMEVYNND